MKLQIILCIAALFALALSLGAPPLSGPDETAHLAYVAALANGRMPKLGGMHQADITSGITFQAQHPPLFYIVAAPIFRIFHQNLSLANRLIRLLGVASFLLTIFFVYKLTSVLDKTQAETWPLWAAIFVAANPHLLFISSMANNDGLALMLGIACLLFAAQSTHSEQATEFSDRSRWPIVAAVCGGLALLTKFTAIGLVIAAAFVVGRGASKAEGARRGGFLLLGSFVFLVPWLFYMKSAFGTVAPQQFHPVFTGGWIEAITQPVVAIYAAYMVWGEICLGMALPLWQTHTLFGDFEWYFYVEWFLGFLVGGGACWLAWRQKQLWAVIVLLAVWGLIYSQALFRDREALLFASRYGPVAAVGMAVAAAALIARQSSKLQRALLGVWISSAIGIYIFIFSFLGRSH